MPAATDGPWPNFPIVGASKSGTSSLYRSLRQHPDSFMSEEKEPGFFHAALDEAGDVAATVAEAEALVDAPGDWRR